MDKLRVKLWIFAAAVFGCTIFEANSKPLVARALDPDASYGNARRLYSHFVRSSPARISFFGQYPVGTSACSLDPMPPILSGQRWVLAAVSKEDFLDSMVCGMCIKISIIDLKSRDEPESIYAAVVDTCNACNKGEMTLYVEGKGKYNANFKAVDCAGANEEQSLRAVVRQAGRNMKMQITNSVLPLVGLEIFADGKWICLTRDARDGYYTFGAESLRDVIQLRATSVTGESIGFSLTNITFSKEVIIPHQFQTFGAATHSKQEPTIACDTKRNTTDGRGAIDDSIANIPSSTSNNIEVTSDWLKNLKKLGQQFITTDVPSSKTGQGYSPTLTDADPYSNSTFCRSRLDGAYPNSVDCRKFLLCVQEKTYAKTCPNDLRFNSKEGVCDWPTNIDCSSDVQRTATASASKESEDDEIYTKKFINTKSSRQETNSKKLSNIDKVNRNY